MGEPAVPMNGHAPFARGPGTAGAFGLSESPGQARSRAFVSIPAPGAGISVVSVLGQSFPACRPCRRLALHGGELDAPRTKRREASRLVGRSGLALQLPARLTTGPCSIPGVSRGPVAASRLHSQGRSGARLDNRATRPSSDQKDKWILGVEFDRRTQQPSDLFFVNEFRRLAVNPSHP